MVSMIGMDLPLSAIRAQVASGINFIVQLSRLADGKRRVMSISEITGMEGDIITLQDIFVFQKTGKSEDDEILGEFIPTGIRPSCIDQLMAAGVDIAPTTFMSRRTT